MQRVTPLRERAAWQELARHHREVGPLHLRQLFADDPERGERLTREGAGVFLDLSKNRVVDETLRLLVALAEESGLPARVEAMFSGERINVTRITNSAFVSLSAFSPSQASRRRRLTRKSPTLISTGSSSSGSVVRRKIALTRASSSRGLNGFGK